MTRGGKNRTYKRHISPDTIRDDQIGDDMDPSFQYSRIPAQPVDLLMQFSQKSAIPPHTVKAELGEGTKETKSWTIDLVCANRSVNITIPHTECPAKGKALTVAAHLIFHEFYPEHELPENVKEFSNSAEFGDNVDFDETLQNFRQQKIERRDARIERINATADMSKDETEFLALVETKACEPFDSEGFEVPDYDSFEFSKVVPNPKFTGVREAKDAHETIEIACKVYNLTVDYEHSKDRSGKSTDIFRCCASMHKKEGEEVTFLFKLDHEMTVPKKNFKKLIRELKAGKAKATSRPNVSHYYTMKEELCELLIAQLVEEGVMEDAEAPMKLLAEERSKKAAARAEEPSDEAKREAKRLKNKERSRKKTADKRAKIAEEKKQLRQEQEAAQKKQSPKKKPQQQKPQPQKSQQGTQKSRDRKRPMNNRAPQNVYQQNPYLNQSAMPTGSAWATGAAWAPPQPQYVPMQPMMQPQASCQPKQQSQPSSWQQPKRPRQNNANNQSMQGMQDLLNAQQQQMEKMQQQHQQQIAQMMNMAQPNQAQTGHGW